MKKLIALVMLLSIPGCTLFSKKEPVIVKEYVNIGYNIPEFLLKQCSVTNPPKEEDYLKLTLSQRETNLTEYILYLYRDMKNCNNQLDRLSEYVKKREERIGEEIKK